MSKSNVSFRGVQALRGIAAISVMLFHFKWNINAESFELGDKLFGWGATGVDLFFLISGFVITLSASKAPQGFYGAYIFLKKRALRILPAYYIILIITFSLSGGMSIFHYVDKAANFFSALTFMSTFPNHAPFYIDDNGIYGIRWTLNYELMFYFFITVALLFKKRWAWAGFLFALVLVALPLVMGQQFTLSSLGYPFSYALLGLITNPIIWLFLIGMMIGLALPYLYWLPPKIMALMAALSLLNAIYFFSHGEYVVHGLLSSGWIYSLILLTVVLSESVIGKYVPEILIRLGDISFSLYLIHSLMNNGIGKYFPDLGIEAGYLRLAFSIFLTFLLSFLSYRYIERPFYINSRVNNKTVLESD